jgi:gamma-glutamyltranspeptidase/glutathione hydrolase
MSRLAVGLVIVWLATTACRRHDGDPAAAPPAHAGESAAEPPALAGHGKQFLVVSEGALATAVGRDVLARGGNAVDAAVATAFALAVVHPSAGNLAGGGFAIVHTRDGASAAFDFRETAPAAATPTMFLDANGAPTNASLVGDRAVGVPGSVAGLWTLHHQFGSVPWRDVVAPAIALARDGFAVDAHTHEGIERKRELLATNPASAALWLPAGRARAEGEIVHNPELAQTLERIAAGGVDGFYRGETAHAIAAEMQRGGGLITEDDLAHYAVERREPLAFDYRGYHFATMPLPSSGGVVLAMTAHMLGDRELGKLGWHSVEHVHWLVEIWRRVFAARNLLLGDPKYVGGDVVARLLAPDFDAQLAASIGPRATPSTDIPPLIEGHHTTNLCVVDGHDMAVAMTTTLNTSFGNGVTVGGFLLNNEMDDFAAKPGAANGFGLVQGASNAIEPGKRPLSSMTPTIATDAHGRVALVVGAQGGPRIITEVWQVMSNIVDFGQPVDRAIAAPRLHHQHRPDVVFVQADTLDAETEHALQALGYTFLVRPAYEFGAANAIVRQPDGWFGAADPRGGGAAMGQ